MARKINARGLETSALHIQRFRFILRIAMLEDLLLSVVIWYLRVESISNVITGKVRTQSAWDLSPTQYSPLEKWEKGKKEKTRLKT